MHDYVEVKDIFSNIGLHVFSNMNMGCILDLIGSRAGYTR